MAAHKFLQFLLQRKDAARLEFLEAKRQLEDFEMEWGSQVYTGPWERKDLELVRKVNQAYDAYKKAWVEWYAASNGYSLAGSPGRQKDTPAFAAAIPMRHLRKEIKA